MPSEEKRDDERMVNSAVEALEKLFVESLSKGLQGVLTEANEKAFETGESFYLMLRDCAMWSSLTLSASTFGMHNEWVLS